MTESKSLTDLLHTLQESLRTASSCTPSSTVFAHTDEGISLLNVKTELFLTYLENLVFLILMKIRNVQSASTAQESHGIDDQVTTTLVELRIYLEKGVRPLEGKLKHQLDKLVAAASDADADTAKRNRATQSKSSMISGTADSTDSGSENETSNRHISDLSYRPNPSAFTLKSATAQTDDHNKPDGIYRPVRVAPTALPTTDRANQRAQRPRKSGTVDDFIREELTDAPLPEPSIGADKGLRGKEKERDEERQAYEEQRLVRLPANKETKGRKRGPPGEDLDMGDIGLGRLKGVEFGNLKGPKKSRTDSNPHSRHGKSWEQRVKHGLQRKRR